MNLSHIEMIFAEKLDRNSMVLNADMSKYTSFKTGGIADILVAPKNMEELRFVLYVLGKAAMGCHGKTGDCSYSCQVKPCQGDCSKSKDMGLGVPYMVIGNGSNILVKDGGYRGVIVKLAEGFNQIMIKENTLTAGAGTLLSVAAKAAFEEGLTGLEFASGIPGTLGGAVFMNAGAYNGEMKNIIDEVKVISKDGCREFILTKEEMDLSYRHSVFTETEDIVTEITIRLEKGNKDEILKKMKELNLKRNTKQPVNLPSAGSFFKRPEGYFAGKLIEDAGLKGLSVGGAMVSPLHSGFIVNTGGATTKDILQLMEIVQNIVIDKFGVKLEPEVRIIGE